MGATIVLWGLGIVDALLLTSHGIIAAMLAMLLGRLAAWDRNRQAAIAIAQPTTQERLLADFCENSSIGMCSIAPNGRILWANQAELQLLGFAPQDYIGHHITEFHADASSMTEVLGHLRAGDELREFEVRLRCQDGSIKHVLIDSNVHRRNGELATTRFFTRDITERRQFEAQQRELYSRYESLVTHSPAGIIETDVKGRCVFANDKWCELSGLTRQQALGMGWKQAIHPDDREREWQSWQTHTDAGEEMQINCRLVTPQGTVTWVHGSVVPLRTNTGAITGFLGTISDISALKKAEAVIREARNQAEAANRTKSEFLAKMSHEMRTPLNGIIGMTELVLDSTIDPEHRDYLQTVKQSADSLLTIINELLDFAKVEAGKIVLDKVDFTLADWLRDSLKPLVFRCRQKSLEFECQIDSAIPKQLVGDPEWLRQILVNLVSNAIKFTDRGRVSVAVGIRQASDSRAPSWERDSDDIHAMDTDGAAPIMLHFAVRDSGIGISPEKHLSIFVPFEQADKSITRRYGGTGLGLAIARQLTELMNGQIWVESVMGEGSTFHFTVQLGIATPASQRPAILEATPAPAITAKAPARPLRVMVVEDNLVNQQLIVKLLQKHGHTTAVANDGEDAVILSANDHSFDVILMDMQMPRLGGLEATAQIRAQEMGTDRHVPIIALTASALKGDRARCLSAGMDDYLTKPINRQELFVALAKVAGSVATRAVTAPVAVTAPIPVHVPVAATVPADTIDLDDTSDLVERPITPPVNGTQGARPRDPHHEETFIVRNSEPAPALENAPAIEMTDVINRKTLWKRLDGDRELLKELLEGYRDSCPEVVRELRAGVNHQDPKRVQQAAHQLKGMVGSFSATRAFNTARDMERSGEAGDFTQAPDILARLEAALQEVDAELECIVNQP